MKLKNNLVAMTLDLTEGCNLACDYCFTWSKHKPRKLPEALGKRIIDWWLPQTDPGKHIQLSFWGGEPLLEFELMKKLIAHANKVNKSFPQKRDMEFGGTTNGVLYTPDKVKWCAENRSLFLISLDGVKEAHDKHRKFKNGKGSFNTIEKNVKAALKIAPRHQVRFSIATDTIKYFFQNIQYYVEELGMTNVSFSPVYEGPWTEQKHLDEMREQFYLAIEYAIKKRKEGSPFRMKHLDDTARGNGQKINPMRNPCGAGNFYMGFGVDGFGWPCHRFNKHGISSKDRAASPIIIARPVGKSLEWCNEDWHNSFIDFSKEPPDKCKECELYGRSVCGGGCYATNFDFNGSIRVPPDEECAFNKVQHEAGIYYRKRLDEEGLELEKSDDPSMFDKNKQIKSCVCYNCCYAEGTDQEIIHSDKSQGMSCHCYQTSYTGNYPARTLNQKRQDEEKERALQKKFLDLSRRILANRNLEKTEAQVKLEDEILRKTEEML